MSDDFFSNLQAVTDNMGDIAFTRYATITEVGADGTCTAKEDEDDGVTHENVLLLSHNLQVGDKVVIGFVDNSIYNPVILAGGEEAYTKSEVDALISGASPTGTISIVDTDLFGVFNCINNNFDDISDGDYIVGGGDDGGGISIADTDLFSTMNCVNNNFDDLSDGDYIVNI